MTLWRHGATDDEPEGEQYMAWRAAVPPDALAQRQRVILEAWDDELTQREVEGAPPVDQAALRDRRRARMKVAANLLLFFFAILGAAAGVAVGWMHLVSDPFADAHAYYEAASRLNAGQPLYPPGIDPSSNHAYLYPPLFAIVLRPLALLPYQWFALVWELIVGATFVGLLQRLGTRKRSTWIAIGLLGIPIGWALTVAQAHVPLTLLMAIGQPWSIALAANIKLFPAIIALWWLARRDWESFVAFAAWSALIVLAQVLVDGRDSFAFLSSVGVNQLGEVRNFSPYLVSPLLWALLLAVGGVAIFATARTRYGWAVAVTIATLAPPRLLVYMLTSLLAAVREPRGGRPEEAEEMDDPAAVYRRATR